MKQYNILANSVTNFPLLYLVKSRNIQKRFIFMIDKICHNGCNFPIMWPIHSSSYIILTYKIPHLQYIFLVTVLTVNFIRKCFSFWSFFFFIKKKIKLPNVVQWSKGLICHYWWCRFSNNLISSWLTILVIAKI